MNVTAASHNTNGNVFRRTCNAVISNKQVDALLFLSCVGLSYVVYSSVMMRLAPVTSSLILVMIYAQLREHFMRSTPTLDPSNNMLYSFQPGAILEGKATRVFTGQLVHYNKIHVLFTATCLMRLSSIEFKSTLPALGYFLFVAFLMLLVGMMNIWIVKEWQPGNIYTSRIGFTGVVLALNAFASYHYNDPFLMPTFLLKWLSENSPLVSDSLGSIPIPILHVLQLAIITPFFQKHDLWGHAAGILAGSVCALSEKLLFEHLDLWHWRYKKEGAEWTTLCVVVATIAVFQMQLQKKTQEPAQQPRVMVY